MEEEICIWFLKSIKNKRKYNGIDYGKIKMFWLIKNIIDKIKKFGEV